MNSRIAAAGVIGLALIAGLTLRAQEQSVWDGVYTNEQATRGAKFFDAECAGCHGPGGAGGSMAPALQGGTFTSNYDGQTVGDLFDRNKTSMPPGKEGQLPADEVAAITAYMLQVNNFPAGKTELPSVSMTLKTIKFLAQKP